MGTAVASNSCTPTTSTTGTSTTTATATAVKLPDTDAGADGGWMLVSCTAGTPTELLSTQSLVESIGVRDAQWAQCRDVLCNKKPYVSQGIIVAAIPGGWRQVVVRQVVRDSYAEPLTNVAKQQKDIIDWMSNSASRSATKA